MDTTSASSQLVQKNIVKATLEWLDGNGVKYHQLILGKPRRNEGDEHHYIDDTPVRATRYRGVFGDMVKKTKEIMVFEND